VEKEAKMLTVTESAKRLLKETLVAHSDDPEVGVRLALEPPGRLVLVLGQEQLGDQVVIHEGSKVLLVASELAPEMEEITLSVENADDGPKLVAQKE
jgi:Fe-S cluster assembly iron-binding protein IscA